MLLDACWRYNKIEEQCSGEIVNDPILTALVDLENAIIDAATSGLTKGMCYSLTFLIQDR